MTTPAPSAATRLSRAFHTTMLRLALASALSATGASAIASAQAASPSTGGSRETQVTAAGCLATEADFVRANGMRPSVPGVDLTGHVVLIDGAGTTFAVNGTRERDLLTRVGSRVEVSGTLEGWSSDVSLERLPEDVPLGGPAHEAADASTGRVAGPVLTPPALPRINVRAFRAVEGGCTPLIRVDQRARDLARDGDRPAVARLAAANTPAVDRVRVQGCVLRDPSGSDRLVLSQVLIRRPDVASASAVPGSRPSGSGSGTTSAPRAEGTTGATQAFYLVGQDTLTTALLGSRAEIVGTLAAADAVQPTRGTGHPSAAVRLLTVETVRSIGGGCAP
jgi:hypothetical protein